MQIHLSKPGGQREGPYTVEQINRDLNSKRYRDTDYWAWYEGLEAWVPLHSVPGVKLPADAQADTPAKLQEAPYPTPLQAAKPSAAAAQAISQDPADPELEGAGAKEIASGMPASALEQMFVFTSGEGPATMLSPVTALTVKEVTGEDLESLRARVPRDVFGRCNIGERLRREGTVPSSAWRAMSSLKPEVVQRAREGKFRICVRTFTVEPNDVVALFLFYDKEKL